MSDHLPIAEVPESTWLRALAHALDPDAEASEDGLVPEDEPVGDLLDELADADDGDGDDDGADDDSTDPGDDPFADGSLWDDQDDWSSNDAGHDAGDGSAAHDPSDDGIG